MALLTLMATGMTVGFLFAAPPGAINTEALRRGLTGGFRAALSVELGAVLGDTFWLCVALIGAAAFLQAPWAHIALSAAGASGLLYLAVRTLRSSRCPPDLNRLARVSGKGGFATGALMALANPFALAFWLTVGGGLGSALQTHVGRAPSHILAFVSSFMAGCLAWAVSFSALIAGGRRLITPALFRWVNLVLGVAMAGFSAWLWYTVIIMLYR